MYVKNVLEKFDLVLPYCLYVVDLTGKNDRKTHTKKPGYDFYIQKMYVKNVLEKVDLVLPYCLYVVDLTGKNDWKPIQISWYKIYIEKCM